MLFPFGFWRGLDLAVSLLDRRSFLKRRFDFKRSLDGEYLNANGHTQPAILQVETPPVAAPQIAPEVAATPAEWPACPRCHSREFVHRAGFCYLKQYPPMQKYECTKCGKGIKFFAPSEVKHRPGKVRKLATVPILARIDEIRALSEQFPQGEVARRVGTSRSYLSRLYQRYSIPLKSFPKPPKPEPEPSITVTKKIDNKMKEMAAIRGCSIALYLQQLAEAELLRQPAVTLSNQHPS